jgi:hypothetical protein
LFRRYFNSIQKSMPRYYFHFRAGSSTLKDEVGEVLADASTALQHARRIALELARGGESTNASIIVIGRFSKFRYPNWATETAACYAPPNLRDANSLPCRNGGWIRANSVTILYPANVPTPPVPEAFASDVTSRPEIDGFVRVSLIIGPWDSKRSAKDGPCRQSADNRRDRKAMTPSSVRRR